MSRTPTHTYQIPGAMGTWVKHEAKPMLPVPVPTHEFGDTSPCLLVAKKHGVDWLLTLSTVDSMIHGRKFSVEACLYEDMVNDDVASAMRADCRKIADRMLAMKSNYRPE